VELADPDVILALLESAGPRSRSTRVAVERGPAGEPVRATKSRRCRCGVCAHCLENARWERIFNEKFVDPTYYQRRPVTMGSSLDWRP